MAAQSQAHPLVLDTKHPGINDAAYTTRRRHLYDVALDYRVNGRGFPHIDYTAEENEIWRHVASRLEPLHNKSACALYLHGKQVLQIETDAMPQLGVLNDRLLSHHNFGMVPAEGLLDVTTFFSYLSQGRMPVTQFIRHKGYPEFTPEPDAVHDCLGHVPCLMDSMFTDVVRLIGKGVREAANPDHLEMWQRLYWFTVEFGLIKEGDATKVIGAGLLSSIEEMDYCFSKDVERRPFVLDDVITQTYDPTRMQPILFVIPSLADLQREAHRLLARF